MDRHTIEPRQGWQSTIEEQGLIYWETELDDGTIIPYWRDDVYYSLTSDEVYDLEAVARVMQTEMLIEAGDFIVEHNLFHRMGIPGWAVPRIKETWESEPPMLYGRFDFAYGETGVPKLLEYNADTPTCLLETAVQWHWLIDHFGEGADQWNSVHERLVGRWKELARQLPGRYLHFLHTSAEKSGEDFMTIGYLGETAKEAGLNPQLMSIEQVGWDDEKGFIDLEGNGMRSVFKLYPWEWMVHEDFSQKMLDRMGPNMGQTQWIEPIWKMMWSNKGILPVLWHLYPDHDNLLPSFFTDEAGEAIDVFGHELRDTTALAHFVKKPLLAREGANTLICISGKEAESGPDQGYGEEGYVVQQYTDLSHPNYAGIHPVLGVWVVDMEPAGLGIRESDNLITNNQSRFAPHVIA